MIKLKQVVNNVAEIVVDQELPTEKWLALDIGVVFKIDKYDDIDIKKAKCNVNRINRR